VDGVLVVDKPSGPTSHDVVSRARRVFGTREVGHAGTLDPMASGVLVLMFGQACKLSAYLTAQEKRYRAEVHLGRSTDSLDAQGTTTEERQLAPGWLDADALERALSGERAREQQEPPALSALKVDGVRAYRRARRGESVALAERRVTVHELTLLRASDATLELELLVSKGYYVRALARDLGRALGVPAHLSLLRRLASGPFTLADAAGWPLDSASAPMPTAEAAKRALPHATLTAEGAARARTGRALGAEHFVTDPIDLGAWLAESGELVALGARDDAGAYRVLRGFAQA